jgi:glycosyltransferase involved in cell wall biosynthesis
MGTLLFFSYWGSSDPLTGSSVIPTLHMLREERLAERIILCTVERGKRVPLILPEGVEHRPFEASGTLPQMIARGVDMLRIVPRLVKVARSSGASMIVARGVVAGGYMHFVHRRTGIPYAVDYFEPHADYMADVGEWSRGGPFYRTLNALIGAQLRTARYQVTVSHNYRRMLMERGADGDRILVAPCPMDPEKMAFNSTERQRIRAELGWSDAAVGIYAGKFGGLYHREKAYRAFAEAARIHRPHGRLIVLTTMDHNDVRQGLLAAGMREEEFHVRAAKHDQVPAFLSAADYAWAPYRGTPSSACISPMKIGEYWANGLPVLLTRGVGDDSRIIENDPWAGSLFDPEANDLPAALGRVVDTIAREGQRQATAALAKEHRSMRFTTEAFRKILA